MDGEIADQEIQACIELALDYGADINAIINNDGSTLLIDAISSGELEFVKLLLDRRADVNVSDSEGKIALFYAVDDSIECFDIILQETQYLDKADNANNTVLMEATNHGYINYMKSLMSVNWVS